MIRIGLCQCRLSFEQPEENLAMMERFLLYAHGPRGEVLQLAPDAARRLRAGEHPCPMTAKKADLLLFPELTLTGFTMKSGEFAIGRDSQMIKRVREMAVRYGIAIGFGCVTGEAGPEENSAPEKEEDNPSKSDRQECRPKNTYFIIDKNGQLLADYAKLHPFSYAGEDCHYSPGTAPGIFALNGVCFGVTVCYDLRFPEIYQAYADTCDAIIVAANWPAKRAEHWNALLKARAIETQCYIAAVNCVGDMDGQYYRGDSQVTDPDGKDSACGWEPVPLDLEDSVCKRESVSPDEECLPCAGEEGILFAEIEEERVRKSREAFPVRRDRRNDLYRRLLK